MMAITTSSSIKVNARFIFSKDSRVNMTLRRAGLSVQPISSLQYGWRGRLAATGQPVGTHFQDCQARIKTAK
jgi:hypothetical protein